MTENTPQTPATGSTDLRRGGRRRSDFHPIELSDSWFRSLVEQSLAGIYVVTDERFVYVNPTFARLFGYSVREILEERSVEDLVCAEHRSMVRENIRKRLRGEVESLRYEFRGRRKDGSSIEVDVHGTRTSIGGLRAVVGLLVDVTERNRTRRELERLYAEARKAVRAREEVLAVVSHDLRNPLNAIGMSLDLIAMQNPGQEALHDSLTRLRRLVGTMDVLIRDLLDISAIDAGTFRIDPSEEDLRPIAEAALEMMRPRAAAKGIDLEADLGSAPVRAHVDRDRIAQVLCNLLDNAIKFTPQQGRVRLRLSREADGATAFVEDTGPGIPAADIPRLFDRFWKRGLGDGAGLGLAIAHGIVEAHGGGIRVASEEGRGTKFRVWLPGG